MTQSERRLATLDDIRSYVSDTLGQLESLEPRQYPLTQHLVTRAGKPCGLRFCLHGPRAVELTAIWEAQQNTILFYSSRGVRVQRTQLVAAPPLETVVAC
ncbi:MAG TPA: hypothetical protein PJ982_08100 [Lacipirellulaceae bacterium]|nr:hypothetical protein [Lacipirellulaceae bacterium]